MYPPATCRSLRPDSPCCTPAPLHRPSTSLHFFQGPGGSDKVVMFNWNFCFSCISSLIFMYMFTYFKSWYLTSLWNSLCCKPKTCPYLRNTCSLHSGARKPQFSQQEEGRYPFACPWLALKSHQLHEHMGLCVIPAKKGMDSFLPQRKHLPVVLSVVAQQIHTKLSG